MLSLIPSVNFWKFSLTKERGIIVFEHHHDFYFIKTQEKNLTKLLAKNDTLKIISLGSPGDAANDIDGFKAYLTKSIVFNSITCLKSTDDFQEKQVEYRDTLEYKRGYIFYEKSKIYKLKKRFDKITGNGKVTVFEIETYVPIERFEADDE